MAFVYGIFLSMIFYLGLGVGFLLGALLIGGKSIYFKLKEKYQRK
jgi:hypothetical protein